MKYYELKRGDYIQSGDEYCTDDEWLAVGSDYFGWRFGFSLDGVTPKIWLPVRRLVPDTFVEPSLTAKQQVQIDEQWGLEFELW